ncbi:Ms4533A family Cys-rich leader peptide [Streptomyces subrutilus]
MVLRMSHLHTVNASAAIELALLGVTAHSVADILCR